MREDPTRSGQKKTNPNLFLHKVSVFSKVVSTGGNPHTTPKPGSLSDGIIIITGTMGQRGWGGWQQDADVTSPVIVPHDPPPHRQDGGRGVLFPLCRGGNR